MAISNIVFIITIFSLITSCNSVSKTNKIVFSTNKPSRIEIKDFEFKTLKGGLYFHINNRVNEDVLINDVIVNKIEFYCTDTIYQCKPYDVFSSEIVNTTFSFATLRDSKKMQYFHFDNKNWILIGLDEQLDLVK